MSQFHETIWTKIAKKLINIWASGHKCRLHILHPKDELHEVATSLHYLDSMIKDEGIPLRLMSTKYSIDHWW